MTATRRILITGGTGFIGSNLGRELSARGNSVHCIVRSESDYWRLESIRDKLNFHIVDVTNFQEIDWFIQKLHPQIILHLASHPGYTGKQEDVEPTVAMNVLGTINLINACCKTGFDCFINTGSSSEYGAKEKPMNETDPIQPNNLYGLTKAAGTLYGQLMAQKLDAPIVALRLFSPYGYYDRGRLIPAVINGFLSKTDAIDLHTPDAVRDYIFIEDVMDAYFKIMQNPSGVKGDILNIGSGKQYSVSEVVQIIRDLIGTSKPVRYGAIKARQYEPRAWIADISRARMLLHWTPNISLKEGLSKTIAWMKRNLNHYEGYY